MKVHHFGHLTSSIKKSIKEFSLLGYAKVGKIYFDDARGINIQFIRSASGELIELIEPASEMSIVKSLVPASKNKIYHVCYYTADIEQEVARLQEQGFVLISPPQPAVALNNNRVAFLLSRYAGMIELYENYRTK